MEASIHTDTWLRQLADEGFVTFRRSEVRPNLATIVTSLSMVRVRQDRLSPAREADARPNTLSSRYGLGAFPLHTDRSLDEPPPRYVLLFAPRPRAGSTILWDTRCVTQETRSLAIFAIGDRGRQRYARFEEVAGNERIVRYNPSLCEPRTTAAFAVVEEIASMRNHVEVDWTEHASVVIDNWRILHGRRELAGGRPGYLRRVTGWIAV